MDLGRGRRCRDQLGGRKTLESLPGVDPAAAQSVIDGRPYRKPETIIQVKGIKRINNNIKDRITVR